MSDLQTAMTEWSKHNDNVQYLLRGNDEYRLTQAEYDRQLAGDEVAHALSQDHNFTGLSQRAGWLEGQLSHWEKRARAAEAERGQFKLERDDLHDLSVKLAFELVKVNHGEAIEALRDDAYAKSILNRPDMQESLRQMRDGEVRSTEEIEEEIAERGTSLWDEDEIDAAKVAEALKTPDDTVPFVRRTWRFEDLDDKWKDLLDHHTCCGQCTGQSEDKGCTCVSDSLIAERHGERWCCDERTTPRQSVLDEAGELIHGPRNEGYGNPDVNMRRIADFWNVFLQDQLTAPIQPYQAAWMSAFIKAAREMQSPKRDSYVDAIGYLAIAWECKADDQS